MNTKFQDFFKKKIVRYVAAALAVAVSSTVIYLILLNFRIEPTTFTVTKTTSTEVNSDTTQDRSPIVYFSKSGEKYHIKNTCGGRTLFPCSLSDALDMVLEECKICSKNNHQE